MKKQDIIEIFFEKLFPVAVFSFIIISLVIQEDISLAKQVMSFPGIDADLACNKQVQEALSLLESEPLRDPRAPRWVGKLAASLKPGRFAHSLSVAWMSRRLAHVHGLDPLKAEQAGLLHDCAKCLPLDEMQRIAVDHSLTDDPELLASGALLHSVVGSWVAREDYGMTDPDVLEAISYHNTGYPGMTRLDMCVCLSDSIEPLREAYPRLEQIRALAETSLERALLLSLEGTADFVTSRGKFLHPRTQNTIAWLKRSLSEAR